MTDNRTPRHGGRVSAAIITLGCDKNTVDSERYLAELVAHGVEPAVDVADAEIIVVNTCGFIDAAKKESIDAIVAAGRQKEEGRCRALVVVGCMVERHHEELRDSLPEADILIGTSDASRLTEELHARGLITSEILAHPGSRVFTGDLPHLRYLKVSEGCDHSCAFCAIPLMRGRHRSFSLAELVNEAQLLESQGALEINLVAQDLAHYGRSPVVDGAQRRAVGLAELLEALVAGTSVPWLRLLYLYSAGITPRLLEVVAREPRILRYLDMPIQHGCDAVLARMRRPERKRTIRDKVARYRDALPEVVIRTTCIVGFPGETEQNFLELIDLLEELQFDRVGAFTYSPQAGTRAAELPDDVPETVKRDRLERLMEVQRAITAERLESKTGRRVTAIVDRGDDGDGCEARAWFQAHDVDGILTLDTPVPAGSLVEVAITGVVDDHDLTGSLVRVLPSRTSSPVSGKSLPIFAHSGGNRSFGR